MSKHQYCNACGANLADATRVQIEMFSMYLCATCFLELATMVDEWKQRKHKEQHQ